MLTTLNAVAPIFVVIITGYILKRTKLVPTEMWPIVEHICFYLLFPFLIIRTLARADLGAIPIANFAIVITGGVIGMALLLLLLQPISERRLGISGPSFTSIFQGATRFHGFMALAVVGSLYGDEGVALSGIAIGVMVPMINALNVGVLTIFGETEEKPDWKTVILKIVSNPLIIACVIGFAFNATGIPGFLYGAIDIIGDGGLGLALLAVGAGLNIGQGDGNENARGRRRADATDRDAALGRAFVLGGRTGRAGTDRRDHHRRGAHGLLGLCHGAADGRRRRADGQYCHRSGAVRGDHTAIVRRHRGQHLIGCAWHDR